MRHKPDQSVGAHIKHYEPANAFVPWIVRDPYLDIIVAMFRMRSPNSYSDGHALQKHCFVAATIKVGGDVWIHCGQLYDV
jgi:hypothetical protein